MSGKALPTHINENLSQGERSFFKTYLSAIEQLNSDYAIGGTPLDLTVDLTPPKELFVEVRIKKDYGSIMLPESGEVHLQKNTTHLLRRSEVDHLIKQGIVAEII
jgi:GINS complex subunit 1